MTSIICIAAVMVDFHLISSDGFKYSRLVCNQNTDITENLCLVMNERQDCMPLHFYPIGSAITQENFLMGKIMGSWAIAIVAKQQNSLPDLCPRLLELEDPDT